MWRRRTQLVLAVFSSYTKLFRMPLSVRVVYYNYIMHWMSAWILWEWWKNLILRTEECVEKIISEQLEVFLQTQNLLYKKTIPSMDRVAGANGCLHNHPIGA